MPWDPALCVCCIFLTIRSSPNLMFCFKPSLWRGKKTFSFFGKFQKWPFSGNIFIVNNIENLFIFLLYFYLFKKLKINSGEKNTIFALLIINEHPYDSTLSTKNENVYFFLHLFDKVVGDLRNHVHPCVWKYLWARLSDFFMKLDS